MQPHFCKSEVREIAEAICRFADDAGAVCRAKILDLGQSPHARVAQFLDLP